MPRDAERARHIVQHFGHVLAQRAQGHRNAGTHTGPHAPPHRAATVRHAGAPACAVVSAPADAAGSSGSGGAVRRSVLRDRRAQLQLLDRVAASRRRRRTARATALPGAASIARCATPVPAIRCARLAVRRHGVPIRLSAVLIRRPAVAARLCAPPRVATAGRVTRSPCAAVLRDRAASSMFRSSNTDSRRSIISCCRHIFFNSPSLDATCAPARASQCPPAASTIAPMSGCRAVLACGQMKRPRSSRLLNRHRPWPSPQSTLISSPNHTSFSIPIATCRGRVSLAPAARRAASAVSANAA